MAQQKQLIVTFKAEDSLVEALRGVSNRSAFIRSAVLAALKSTCPLCGGTGILTREQKDHWDAFALDHAIKECNTCHEWHLVCGRRKTRQPHKPHRRSQPKRGPRK